MFGFKKKKEKSSKEKSSKENLLIFKGSVTRCGRPVSPFRNLSDEEIKILEENLKKTSRIT